MSRNLENDIYSYPSIFIVNVPKGLVDTNNERSLQDGTLSIYSFIEFFDY